MKTILVILETPSFAGRSQLIGILRRINAERLEWKLQIISSRTDFSPQKLKSTLNDDIDGVIVAVPQGQSLPTLLTDTALPMVVMDVAEPSSQIRKDTVFVRIDDRAIGEYAARHILSLGNFRSYVFAHDPRMEIWSVDRCKAFADTLASARKSCSTIRPDNSASRPVLVMSIADALRSLLPPIAAFAANDLVADTIREAAKIAGLRIPDDLSLLGVDNDESFCCRRRPEISSIRPDFEEEGYRAVGALLRLFGHTAEEAASASACKAERQSIRVDLVERESTRPTPPATRLVERALAFINDNFTKPITVQDVVSELGVSRRLADLRFQQFQKETILRTLTSRRLKRLARLVATTSEPFNRLALSCGFGSFVRAAHLFKATYGMSMKDWRDADLPRPENRPTRIDGRKRKTAAAKGAATVLH